MTVWEPVFALLTGKKRRTAKAKEAEKKTGAKDWLDRIKRASEAKDLWEKDFRVDLALDYWEGRNRPSYYAEDEWISVNVFFSVLKATLPALYASDPYFYVKLRRSFSPDPSLLDLYEQMGQVRQSFLNYLKGECDLKSKARLAVFDAFFQFGVLKVSLDSELYENERAGQPILGDDGLPLAGDDGQELTEPEWIPANKTYKIERVNPKDFLVDEDAGPIDPDDVRWVAQRVRRRLEEVQEDKRYSKAARGKLTATELSDSEKRRQEKRKGSSWGSTAEPDVVCLWEIYDLEEEEWLVVADGCDEYLMEPTDLPAGVEGTAFATLRFVVRPDSWYPLPPATQWIDQQREYCESRSAMLRHRKNSGNRKYVLYRQAFDDAEDAASRLEGGEDGMVLIADLNPGYAPVAPIADAPLDQSQHLELSYIRKDLEDLAIGASQRGSSQGVESATEAGILEARARMRESDERTLVAEFLQTVARKLDQLVQAHLTEDQYVRITGGPADGQWALIRAQDYQQIEGEYEYKIDVDAEVSQTPDAERAGWTALMGLFPNAPPLFTSRAFVETMASLHHIKDERMIDEIVRIAQQLVGGGAGVSPAGSMPGSGVPAAAEGPTVGGAMGLQNMMAGTPNVEG